MARRNKQKYRDVVGKNKNFNKKNIKKKPPRTKKTYSLYKNENRKEIHKRQHDNSDEIINKRTKVEVAPILESSEDEIDLEDHMKQLRDTFAGAAGYNNKAVDSEESDSEEGDNEQQITNNEDSVEEFSDSDTEVEKEKEIINEETVQVADECEIDAVTQQEEENENENVKDPFVRHIQYDLHEKLLESLQSKPIKADSSVLNWPKLGSLSIQIPTCTIPVEEEREEITIVEKRIFAPLGEIPEKINNKAISPEDLYIKPQIVNNLQKANKFVFNSDMFTPLQAEIFSVINNYQDFYFSERNFDNAEEIRFVYCLHAVNHILKTRIKVIHHNARLTRKQDVPEEFRDQGLVRPKILMLVPFKDSAYKIIRLLIDIILPEDKGNVMNKSRFIEEYTGNELMMPKKNPKPEDYEKTFTGNTSDDFKIGITITKKSIKLYADFYSADIIIASPLGLRTVIGAVGEPERDYDFLASIELLIFDQTEIFLMQNWDHVVHIMSHLHMQPKSGHGSDFSRVRTWSLNGWSKYYRQTLIFSSFVLPDINSIFHKHCVNYAGKVKTVQMLEFGCISQVFVQLPHVFHKFEAKSYDDSLDARFEFFVNKILPQQMDSMMKQTLIFIPNYFDYVRVRNYFKREDIGFVQICEYSKEGKIARARDMFYHGDAHFILYTERYHFFNRIRVKGIRHLVFYQPPNFPQFYYEMCNLMQETNMNPKIGNNSNMTINVIYSKYDIYQLSQIVGTNRAAKMIQTDRKVHMMVTGAD